MIIKFPNENSLYVACSNKCGSSSVVSILGYPHNQKHLSRKGKSKPRKDNMYWERFDRSPYTFETIGYRIAIVRHPVERLVSCFKDRALQKNRGNILSTVKTWEDFVYNLQDIRKQFIDIRKHTEPQCISLGQVPEKYDRVFKTDEISYGFLSEIERISETRIPTIQTKTSSSIKTEISVTPDQVKIIEDFYSDDYTYWRAFFQ